MVPWKGVKSKKYQEAEKELINVVAEDPSISTWKAATAFGVSQTLILTMLHDDGVILAVVKHNDDFF